ncbi:hypothetical protein [Nonomuraea basaltis]|uniref:hypothetical protein n=1 Tax=Nonomuraea basaltis TaxID=2495887 RepID=UPI0014860937|nr:hypothetical protein [Nonomuraea basaltis]
MTATEPLALRPPRHRIERRAILWWTLNALIWGATLVGGLGLLYVKAASVRPWLLAALPAWLGAHDRRPVSRDAVGALAALDSGAAGQGSDRGYLYALACSVYRSA